jgi:hypothetical protein
MESLSILRKPGPREEFSACTYGLPPSESPQVTSHGPAQAPRPEPENLARSPTTSTPTPTHRAPPAPRFRGTRSAAVCRLRVRPRWHALAWRGSSAYDARGGAACALLAPRFGRSARQNWLAVATANHAVRDKPHGMLTGNSAIQHTVRTDTSDGGRGKAFGTSVRSDVHESQSVLLLNSNQTSWVSGPVPNFWQVVQFRIFPS